jgi:hypothetical protein
LNSDTHNGAGRRPVLHAASAITADRGACGLPCGIRPRDICFDPPVGRSRGDKVCDRNHRTCVTREMADDMIDVLAALHARFHGDGELATRYRWVAGYPR